MVRKVKVKPDAPFPGHTRPSVVIDSSAVKSSSDSSDEPVESETIESVVEANA